jgi:hypothetical protein
MRESEQRARRWVLRELTRLCERDQQAKASAETPRCDANLHRAIHYQFPRHRPQPATSFSLIGSSATIPQAF